MSYPLSLSFAFPHKGLTLLLTLFALLFATLGVWQVQRLEWKLNLINTIQNNTQNPPLDFFSLLKKDQHLLPPSSSYALIPSEFHPTSLQGQFLHEKHVFFVERSPGGGPGVHVIMAFQPSPSPDNPTPHALLVDRGWIPFDVRKQGGWQNLLPEKINTPPSSFKGTLRYFRPPSFVRDIALPNNSPSTNTFFRLDPLSIQKKLNTKINTQAYLLEELPPGTRRYPIAGPWTPNLPNHHLLYAITWFSLTLLIPFLWTCYGFSLGRSQQKNP